jgi:hypothetical protein
MKKSSNNDCILAPKSFAKTADVNIPTLLRMTKACRQTFRRFI